VADGLVSGQLSSAGTVHSTLSTPNLVLPLVSPVDPAYAYYALPAAPPPEAAADEEPPAPGRGGPTYIGEERAGGITIAVPGR
jgi:hypothetical protein